jgi:trk system potassium uptake protein TrkH
MGLYLLLTLAITLAYISVGVSPSDALYHAMTALSTGGFSSHSSSVAWFHSFAVEIVTIVAMLVGAYNFADIHQLLRARTREGLSGEGRVMAVLLAAALPLAALLLHGLERYRPLGALRLAAFDAATALSTTGFGIADFSSHSVSYKFLLTVLMFVGGSAFSTAGGIKLYRLAVLASSIKWGWIRVIRGPDYLLVPRVGSTRLDVEELIRVMEVVFLFAIADVAGILALTTLLPRVQLADAAFEATSALCTVGLSVGITSATAPAAVKLVLIALMSLGRLEVHLYLAAVAAAAYKLQARLHRHPRGAGYHLPLLPGQETFTEE